MEMMIDLETLGTRPGCVIASIGIVAFELDDDNVLDTRKVNVAIADAQRRGLLIDADTVLWWFGREEAARQALTSPPPLPLPEALHLVDRFFAGRSIGGVWSHGAGFDLPILVAGYATVGLVPPWNYRMARDTRTIFELAGISLSSFHAVGVHHDARDDAIAQALAVQRAWRILRPARV